MRKLTTSEFIIRASEIHNNIFNYDKVEYINTRTKIIITCILHGDFEMTPYHHISGQGCYRCSRNKHKDIESIITEASIIHNTRYTYTYDESNLNELIVNCKKHGEFKQNLYHHLYGHGCKKCNSSKGENKVEEFLIKNNIKYEKEKCFDTCKNKGYLRFDFYIKDLNILIEFNGIQHYKEIDRFGGLEYLNQVKENDLIKFNWSIDNNLKLITISYEDIDDINSILESNIFV